MEREYGALWHVSESVVCETACQRELVHDYGLSGLRHMCAQGLFSLLVLGKSERVSVSV